MRNSIAHCHKSNEPASPTFGKGGAQATEGSPGSIPNDDTPKPVQEPNPREFNDPGVLRWAAAIDSGQGQIEKFYYPRAIWLERDLCNLLNGLIQTLGLLMKSDLRRVGGRAADPRARTSEVFRGRRTGQRAGGCGTLCGTPALYACAAISRRVCKASFSRMLCTWLLTV